MSPVIRTQRRVDSGPVQSLEIYFSVSEHVFFVHPPISSQPGQSAPFFGALVLKTLLGAGATSIPRRHLGWVGVSAKASS